MSSHDALNEKRNIFSNYKPPIALKMMTMWNEAEPCTAHHYHPNHKGPVRPVRAGAVLLLCGDIICIPFTLHNVEKNCKLQYSAHRWQPEISSNKRKSDLLSKRGSIWIFDVHYMNGVTKLWHILMSIVLYIVHFKAKAACLIWCSCKYVDNSICVTNIQKLFGLQKLPCLNKLIYMLICCSKLILLFQKLSTSTLPISSLISGWNTC